MNTQLLSDNPIRSLPRKLKVNVSGSDCTDANLGIGQKISQADALGNTVPEDASITGIVEGQGGSIVGAGEVVTGGNGYTFSSTTGVPTVALTGSGTGCTVNITLTGDVVTAVAINNVGSNYQVGDILTVDNSSSQVTTGSGLKFTIAAISSTFDSIFLTDVQGSQFTTGRKLVKYSSNNTTKSTINQSLVAGSAVNGVKNTGDVIEVTQFNHAHHGGNNKVEIKNVRPDTLKIKTTSALESDTTTVEIADTSPFANFNGITTSIGNALIGSEIVSYTVGSGKLTIVRGQFGTTPVSHDIGSDIQTYEAGGIALTGINTSFDISTFDDTLDSYFLKVDVTNLASNRSGDTLICFTNDKSFGGKNVQISQNHQFSSIIPQFNAITPGKSTNVSASIRTISGTSSGGSEISFLDQGFEPVTLNESTFLPTPRLVASVKNESERLTSLPKNKSLTLNVDMSTTDTNLSPVLDTKNATFILGRNKINNPVGAENYATDERPRALRDDPHGSVFISKLVTLKNPATSLKVLVAASRQPEADFRVFYRLFSFDSSEVDQTYRPFPGYKNLNDTTGDGFGNDVIDFGLNDGRPDAFVAANSIGEFSEYQFSIDDLEEFNGFKIKIVMTSTNESVPISSRDFRAIALA